MMRHPIRRNYLIYLAPLVVAALLTPDSAARAQHALWQRVLPWAGSWPARAYAAQENSTEDSLHRYPCPEPNRTQIELDGCAAELQKDAERHLRKTYENLLARVNGGRRVALGTSQAAWASYRDRDCDAPSMRPIAAAASLRRSMACAWPGRQPHENASSNVSSAWSRRRAGRTR